MPEYTLYNKINVYCVFVFGVSLLSTLLTWNVLPPWFEYLDDIKELYTKKYFERDSSNLPHLTITRNVDMNTLNDKIKFEEKEKQN